MSRKTIWAGEKLASLLRDYANNMPIPEMMEKHNTSHSCIGTLASKNQVHRGDKTASISVSSPSQATSGCTLPTSTAGYLHQAMYKVEMKLIIFILDSNPENIKKRLELAYGDRAKVLSIT